MERELLAVSAIVDQPARPLVAILGGAGLGGQIGLVRRLLDLADVVCVGGAMCLSFLWVLGHGIGSPPRPQDVDGARRALEAAKQSGRLEVPSDLLVRPGKEPTGSEPRTWHRLEVLDEQTGFDIGPETADRYAAEIGAAATVFWSGSMGRVEFAAFAGGTRAIAEAFASTSATTVVGGRETVQAMRAYGLQDRVSHLSTGGGATLQLLEGRDLPGLRALRGVASQPGGRPRPRQASRVRGSRRPQRDSPGCARGGPRRVTTGLLLFEKRTRSHRLAGSLIPSLAFGTGESRKSRDAASPGSSARLHPVDGYRGTTHAWPAITLDAVTINPAAA